jgi:hypothetical protein
MPVFKVTDRRDGKSYRVVGSSKNSLKRHTLTRYSESCGYYSFWTIEEVSATASATKKLPHLPDSLRQD